MAAAKLVLPSAPTAAGVRTGTLTIVSNDPVNPRAGLSLVGIGDSVYAQPVIMTLDSPTAQIQNGPITIHVTGANFYPASIVQADGIAQPTTYMDSGDLQATLGGSVAAADRGDQDNSVQPHSRRRFECSNAAHAAFAVLNLSAAFLASAPGSKLVYASMPSWSVTNPNTVIPITAATGNLGNANRCGE